MEAFEQHTRAALAHQAAAACLVRGAGEADQAGPRREQQGQQNHPQADVSAADGECGGGAVVTRPMADASMDELPVLDLQEQSEQLYG